MGNVGIMVAGQRGRSEMRFVVTGAAGFIGSALVERLLSAGHQVIGIDNLKTGAVANLENATRCNDADSGRFRLINLDVQAPELAGIMAGANPDVIFHLAAQVNAQASILDPQFDARSNVLGTINLCEASRIAGIRRIVYATCVGPSSGATPSPEDSPSVDLATPHAVAKLAGELYLNAYADLYGLAPICLALGSVYGPRQNPRGSGGVIAALAGTLITGLPSSVYRDNAKSRDYVYIDDVVDAFMRAGHAPSKTKGTFDIGTGRYTTVTDLRGLIAAVLDGTPLPSVAMSPAEKLCGISPVPSRAERHLGWKPTVDLPEGIRRTVSWLCDILEPSADSAEQNVPLAG